MFKEIIVRFRCTQSGLTETSYAADLSQRLGCRLSLSVPGLQPQHDPNMLARLSVCLRDQAPASLLTAAENNLVDFFDEHGKTGGDRLLVGSSGGLDRNGFSHLLCYDETTFGQAASDERTLELLLPFGDSFGSLGPSLETIQLAKDLDASICFYHTTWREPGLDEVSPERHMCEAARNVLTMASHRCRTAGVPHSTLIECADDIAQGVVRAALRRGSSLIVAAYGRRTFRGSYVDQVIQRSTVPVLVVSEKGGGK